MQSCRLSLLLAFLLLAPCSVHLATAQVVETFPSVPLENEGVTVYFNADEGTGELAGYDGDGHGQEQRKIRLSHEAMDAAVVGNFGLETLETTVTFPQDGTLYDVFEGGEAVEATDATVDLTLPPGYFHLFTSEEVDFPREGLVGAGKVDPVDPPEPAEFAVGSNYPNPVDEETTVPFELDDAGFVTLELFDALGRRIDVIIENEHHEADQHEVVYDARRLPGGLYFYRLRVGGQTDTAEMVIVR